MVTTLCRSIASQLIPIFAHLGLARVPNQKKPPSEDLLLASKLKFNLQFTTFGGNDRPGFKNKRTRN